MNTGQRVSARARDRWEAELESTYDHERRCKRSQANLRRLALVMWIGGALSFFLGGSASLTCVFFGLGLYAAYEVKHFAPLKETTHRYRDLCVRSLAAIDQMDEMFAEASRGEGPLRRRPEFGE